MWEKSIEAYPVRSNDRKGQRFFFQKVIPNERLSLSQLVAIIETKVMKNTINEQMNAFQQWQIKIRAFPIFVLTTKRLLSFRTISNSVLLDSVRDNLHMPELEVYRKIRYKDWYLFKAGTGNDATRFRTKSRTAFHFKSKLRFLMHSFSV